MSICIPYLHVYKYIHKFALKAKDRQIWVDENVFLYTVLHYLAYFQFLQQILTICIQFGE